MDFLSRACFFWSRKRITRWAPTSYRWSYNPTDRGYNSSYPSIRPFTRVASPSQLVGAHLASTIVPYLGPVSWYLDLFRLIHIPPKKSLAFRERWHWPTFWSTMDPKMNECPSKRDYFTRKGVSSKNRLWGYASFPGE